MLTEEAMKLKRGDRVYTVEPWLTQVEPCYWESDYGEAVRLKVVGAMVIDCRIVNRESDAVVTVIYNHSDSITKQSSSRFFATEEDAASAAIENIEKIKSDLTSLQRCLNVHLPMIQNNG